MSYPINLGDKVSKEKIFSQRKKMLTSEAQFKTAERLQKELFSDHSAPLQLALAPLTHSGNRISDIEKEWARVRAMEVKLLIQHMHKPQTPEPAGFMGHRDSGIPDLQEAGLLGPDYHISHANRLTSEELEMMRAAGSMICATTMGEFPYMMADYRGPSVHGRARAAGVATGIGTDVALAVTGDYFEHVRASLWSHYLEAESRAIVSQYRSRDTLDFATAMGARAIRLGDITGSISVGKRADLVLLSTDRIGFGMAGDLADRVVTFANTSDIDSVWIAGKARKRHGKMLGVDWPKLKSDLVEAQDRVARRAATIEWV
jgi:cytosine/adenosine deaminase-related metal-dependent hydrolase